MKHIELYLNYAGFCYSKESHAIRGGRNLPVKFHALFGLIRHPEMGYILYDTGYTRRFYDATASFPNKIYALATKVVVEEKDEIKSQLRGFGLTTSDIRHVIITHFHADHIAGLRDFENATFYCSAAAYKQVKEISPLFGFTKGILKSLPPEDFDARVRIIEENCEARQDHFFDIKYDLFGDGSILVYPLPGHAAGQIGIGVSTAKRSYLLIADACWLKQSYENMILPHPVVRLFFSSWTDFKKSLKRVHTFHQAHPEVIIVPTHCYETTRQLTSERPGFDEL